MRLRVELLHGTTIPLVWSEPEDMISIERVISDLRQFKPRPDTPFAERIGFEAAIHDVIRYLEARKEHG